MTGTRQQQAKTSTAHRLRWLTRTMLALLLLLTAMLLPPPSPVLAIADPDSPPAVNAVYVYENCLEVGDVGVLVDYYLDYAVLPTETATEAYLAVFVDTDGTTQLKSVAPYTYQDSGYGHGLVWIYFTAAEATTHSLDSTDVALYRIWLMGNPTVASGWAGDPPKTIATLDQWNTVTDPSELIALRVLYYADLLELEWTLNLIEETAIGDRLSTLGEQYFTNVISNLRTIAPDCFSSGESYPDAPTISYDTTYGAVAESGTATLTVSPDELTEGTDTVDTGATVGTFTITLARWTFGTIDDLTGTIAGTPIDLTPGVNTLTVTGAGTFTVVTEVVNTITLAEDDVTGTAFDLTALATLFGLSRWFLSGAVWMLIVIIMCAALYRARTSGDLVGYDASSSASKAVMLLFTVGVIGGALLGMLHPLASALLFIGCGALIGYVLFFRSETLHKGFMFMAWMFVIVSLAGNYIAGSSAIVATRLTADLTEGTVNTISVASTTGFPESGYIVIGDETIGYPAKTATTFTRASVLGVTTNPIIRGADGTEDAAHSEDDVVRTREAAGLNASLDYKIARIADSAGIVDFVTLPVKLLDLLMTFFVLPLDFLGTDLAILSYVWGVIAAGMIVGFVLAVLGQRRV